jgi:biotin transporter BioY
MIRSLKLTSESGVLLQMLTVVQHLKKFPVFQETRTFITIFTTPTTSPYPEPDESSSHPPTIHF